MFACLYLPPLASDRPSAARLAGARPLPAAPFADDVSRDSRGALASVVREFSPRVEVHGPGLVTLDAHGLERLFGDAARLGDELRRAAADRGLRPRIALASTRAAAWLLAHARAGLTIVGEGDEARWVSPLPLRVLEQLAANGLGPGSTHVVESAATLLATLKRWGLTTLGEFTRLPAIDLSERFGQRGLAWQQLARGEDLAPLVPDAPEERFEETLDLEWPIEGLQPLSFVLGRLFDTLAVRLQERDRAAAVLHVHLQLVTREVEHRSLQLPAPMRDARALRTLALLHLESHPVTAGIDRVTIVVDPVPGRVLQHSLLARALPMPEQLSTLLARLGAVVGERRCGMAALVDSHRPGAFQVRPFPVEWSEKTLGPAAGARAGQLPGLSESRSAGARAGQLLGLGESRSAGVRAGQLLGLGESRSAELSPGPEAVPLTIRRFRIPVPASVAVKDGRPVRVLADRESLRGGSVQASAGPWRTSGEWWKVADARVQPAGAGAEPAGPERDRTVSAPRRAALAWNRDEWDVNLADGGVYRIYRDRERDRWFVDGVID